MHPYFRAVAVDYDGTLTRSPRPDPQLLDELAHLRGAGQSALLVTGRIMAELRDDFPDVDEWFDLIVAENGAVLSRAGTAWDLAEPVDPELARALAHHDVPVRHGRVLLACDAVHDAVVLAEITRLELDCQLIHNRGALMVLPAGVSKGTGLSEGLEELGLSAHNVLGVGDAENDHSLLGACEVGVAVGNAVDALKAHADMVLPGHDGEGVLELLRGPLLRGEQRLHPARWQVELGHDRSSGRPVRLPASQLNVLVTGASGSGKSHIAGLLSEQLIALGYTVLVVDPEGEHEGLGGLRSTLPLGGAGSPLPPPTTLPDLLASRHGSLILDLSRLPELARVPYLAEVAEVVVGHRSATGLPHWVVLEEAHLLLGCDGPALGLLGDDATGHCLVTYQPLDLDRSVRTAMDVVIAGAGGSIGTDQAVGALTDATGLHRDVVARTHAASSRGDAVLADRRDPGRLQQVALGPRRTSHVRHRKKYAEAELPHHLRFFLHGCGPSGEAVAANLGQLHDLLEHCAGGVVAYHAARRDFSRWIREVICDAVLAAEVEAIERAHVDGGDPETTRAGLVSAIQQRYLDPV